MDITEISDRMELEKLVTDYATAVDTKNFQDFNNLFTQDAYIDYTAVGGIAGNLQEIIQYLETALDHFPNYQHLISNISLTLDGHVASGKVMCFNPMQTEDDQVFFLGMWYQDTYKKINDQWFIASRVEESSWAHNVPSYINTKPQKMIVGLTGGIGSGKSAAANFFQNEGVTVIDADHLAREVIEQNTPGFKSIIEYFGSNILGEDGSINRAQLRKEIFDDQEKKKVLESITHPMVRDLMAERIAASTSPYSIIMVPLIFETNSMSAYNRILVIDCDSTLQLERATLRDNNSSEQIQKILDSQCTRAERLSIANDVIPNNDSLENLKTRSLAMHKFYLGLSKK